MWWMLWWANRDESVRRPYDARRLRLDFHRTCCILSLQQFGSTPSFERFPVFPDDADFLRSSVSCNVVGITAGLGSWMSCIRGYSLCSPCGTSSARCVAPRCVRRARRSSACKCDKNTVMKKGEVYRRTVAHEACSPILLERHATSSPRIAGEFPRGTLAASAA